MTPCLAEIEPLKNSSALWKTWCIEQNLASTARAKYMADIRTPKAKDQMNKMQALIDNPEKSTQRVQNTLDGEDKMLGAACLAS